MEYQQSHMYSYIQETANVLLHIIQHHEEITKAFVECYKNEELHQLYIVGSGTSYHAGEAAKAFLEEVLHWPIRCAYPIPFQNQETIFDPKTLVIGVSQGGQSFSTVYGLDGATKKGCYTAALSANSNARIFEHAQTATLLEVGEEACGAKTKGYCATILTLMLMGLDLAIAKGYCTETKAKDYLLRMERVIHNLPKIIKQSEPWVKQHIEEIKSTNRMIVVGYDQLYADVLEGRLKLLETIRVGVEGYELEEFMHGIYNSVSEDTHIFYLRSASQYRERIDMLYQAMSSLTTHNYMISATGNTADAHSLILPFIEDPLFLAWEYIIPLQMISCIVSSAKGINPDIPADPMFHTKMKSK